MKLYHHPGACSLSSQIALREAGQPFESEDVDLESKRTEAGADFNAINPKGYVPALRLDNGELLTENLAVLDYIADRYPTLGLDGPLGRTRLLEALAYISTELHKSFAPFFANSMWPDKADATFAITRRMKFLADRMRGDYLLGDHPTVADFYLFVMLLWAEKFGVDVPAGLVALRNRLEIRPAVQAALKAEGLDAA
jgi:glutathione S-transferase